MPRPAEALLSRWRELERALESLDAEDDQLRAAIEAEIASVRDEYHALIQVARPGEAEPQATG